MDERNDLYAEVVKSGEVIEGTVQADGMTNIAIPFNDMFH